MIRSHLVKPGFSRSKPVSAGLVWFEPFKTGLSRSKPFRAVQNRFVPIKTRLNPCGLI
ncbi:hypothetical protein CP02DC14_1397 [Chlamydia psittaci 02DC14]|nr:hypothetical protein CP02DC14_1397 [Chlamydia psittaci 02DC14]EPP30737.1 hypothetical protein CPC197_1707 [Chlamydia psittaci C1/97]EPP33124.1 hypothetical protein CPC698_1157 [Chlamydia psittaci C6/98]